MALETKLPLGCLDLPFLDGGRLDRGDWRSRIEGRPNDMMIGVDIRNEALKIENTVRAETSGCPPCVGHEKEVQQHLSISRLVIGGIMFCYYCSCIAPLEGISI